MYVVTFWNENKILAMVGVFFPDKRGLLEIDVAEVRITPAM